MRAEYIYDSGQYPIGVSISGSVDFTVDRDGCEVDRLTVHTVQVTGIGGKVFHEFSWADGTLSEGTAKLYAEQLEEYDADGLKAAVEAELREGPATGGPRSVR